MPIISRGRHYVALRVLPWLLGASVLAGISAFMVVSLTDLRDSTRVSAELNGVRGAAELMIGAAIVPGLAGSDGVATLGADAIASLDSVRPDLEQILGAAEADAQIARITEGITGLQTALVDRPPGPLLLSLSSPLTFAFLSLTRAVDSVQAEVVEASGAATSSLRRTVTVGSVVLALAGIIAAMGFMWANRRMFTLQDRQREVEERYRAGKEERDRFEALADSMSAGLILFDDEERVTYVNQRWAELFGVPTLEVTGRTFAQVRRLIAPQLADPAAYLAASGDLKNADRGQTTHVDIAYPTPRSIKVAAFPVRSPRGLTLGISPPT